MKPASSAQPWLGNRKAHQIASHPLTPTPLKTACFGGIAEPYRIKLQENCRNVDFAERAEDMQSAIQPDHLPAFRQIVENGSLFKGGETTGIGKKLSVPKKPAQLELCWLHPNLTAIFH